MNAIDKALATQLENIQSKTGRSLDELFALIDGYGPAKFGQIRDRLKTELGLGHGDANTLATVHKRSKEAPAEEDADPIEAALATIYAGAKASIRPLHDAVMTRIGTLGAFEIAPKKTYLSLRRRKQFATVGPAPKGQLEIGLNAKTLPDTGRLDVLPEGRMCSHRIRIGDEAELDDELLGWIRTAYDEAG